MPSLLYERSNDVLQSNPPSAQIHITTNGSDWLWAVTAVMIFSSIVFIIWSYLTPRRNRIFHYIIIAITLISSVSYFTLASDLGNAAVPVEFVRSNPKVAGTTRSIFYARFIDWFLTNTLIILALLFTAAAPWPTILYTWFLTEVMVVTLLAGSVVSNTYKWGYFVIGVVALFLVSYNLLWGGRKYAQAVSPTVNRTYVIGASWIVFLWFLYPVSWGLSEGGNVIAPDSEMVFYGVLDILSKPVWGAFILFSHRSIDPDSIGHAIRTFDEQILIREKAGVGYAAQGGQADGVVAEPAPQSV
jgi:bacteriorhodopsin